MNTSVTHFFNSSGSQSSNKKAPPFVLYLIRKIFKSRFAVISEQKEVLSSFKESEELLLSPATS